MSSPTEEDKPLVVVSNLIEDAIHKYDGIRYINEISRDVDIILDVEKKIMDMDPKVARAVVLFGLHHFLHMKVS